MIMNFSKCILSLSLILATFLPSYETVEAPVRPEPITVEAPKVVRRVENESLGIFTITAYCHCPKCCDEWADGLTYTGTKPVEDRTVAVDPDVIPLGSEIVIDGKKYIAEDIGGAIKGKRIDVYFDSHDEALEFGRKELEVKEATK